MAFAITVLWRSLASEVIGPEYGLSFDDWPNGSSFDIDHWHSGTFLGLKADRIRWIGKYKGDHVDADETRYTAALNDL